MDDHQALQQQLEEARDEAELNLLQLQQVQEELEFYFLRCQQQDQELDDLRKQAQQREAEPPPSPPADPDPQLQDLQDSLASSQQAHQALQQRHQEQQHLLTTAQTMLEGQARYLEDVSLREERAAQAIDRLRLLEGEILYYLQHSKPLPSLDPQQINRLVQLAKQPSASG